MKLNGPKTPASDKKKTPAKSKSSSKKQAAKSGSDEETADTPVIEEKAMTPAQLKDKKERESSFQPPKSSHPRLTYAVRYYRHKLQKGFVKRDEPPSDDELKVSGQFRLLLGLSSPAIELVNLLGQT